MEKFIFSSIRSSLVFSISVVGSSIYLISSSSNDFSSVSPKLVVISSKNGSDFTEYFDLGSMSSIMPVESFFIVSCKISSFWNL